MSSDAFTHQAASERSIWVFGNPDKSDDGFPMPGDLTRYLQEDLFTVENGRYRQTLLRDADVIVLSRGGLAYGHVDVASRVSPTDRDRDAYPRVKQVYLVESATLYEQPVRLSELDVRGLSYGQQLSEAKFAEILAEAGSHTRRGSAVQVPASPLEQQRVLREVRLRLGQGEFRAGLMEAYDGRCAISGCEVPEVLEAAHIDPWSESESQDLSNGLLLRSDLHVLFDRGLLGIEPDELQVVLAPPLHDSEYEQFRSVTLATPIGGHASHDLDALRRRWEAFSGTTD